ncbi:MAG TPA: PilZ domain-containing protein [Terriglobales bacterium]|jgi:PilZ domain|nr:PilZ domain-containing protein [Terriglobales bacterium]
MSPFPILRRWPRHPVDLPVSVTLMNGPNAIRVSGRVSEISDGGMALYAGVQMRAGDSVKVEFQTPGQTQVEGVVRSKAGCSFGIEFVAPLSGEQRAPLRTQTAKSGSGRSQAEFISLLRRKEQEIQRLRTEIEILQTLAKRGRL